MDLGDVPRRCIEGRRRLAGAVVALLAAWVLSACTSIVRGPDARLPGTPADERDGPPLNPPPGLARTPDAEPRVETIRAGGPNKPYEALGQAYVPLTQDVPFRQRGLASWYGRKFHGRRTASGEPYDMYAMTGAHPTLPLPSYARLRNPANGAEVVVRINDRGPFHSERIVDVSYTAALKLGLLASTQVVELERITFDDIRSGLWRRPGDVAATRLAATPGSGERAETAPRVVVPVPVPAPTALLEPAPPGAGTMPMMTSVPQDVLAAQTASATAPLPSPLSPSNPPMATTTATTTAGFWVQLGAFQQRSGAESFHRRVAADVEWLAPLLAVFVDAPLYRLQAGPYPSRGEAQGVAQRVREALKLMPLVLERR